MNVNMIQRYCSYILVMLEWKLSQNMVLVNCLNMTCQNAGRMTMLEKGTCLQWRPLVYSDLPTQENNNHVTSVWQIRSSTSGVQLQGYEIRLTSLIDVAQLAHRNLRLSKPKLSLFPGVTLADPRPRRRALGIRACSLADADVTGASLAKSPMMFTSQLSA